MSMKSNNNNNFNPKNEIILPSFQKFSQNNVKNEYKGVAMVASSQNQNQNQFNIGGYRSLKSGGYGGGVASVSKANFSSDDIAPSLFGSSMLPAFDSKSNNNSNNNNSNNSNNSNNNNNNTENYKYTLSNLSPLLSFSSQSSQIEQNKNFLDEPEFWNGPMLFDSGFLCSNFKPQNAKSNITDTLKKLTEDSLIDWTDNGYELIGRMFDNNGEMAEFRITIWKVSEDLKHNSIVHIRKQAGDGFLYSEFQDKILESFQEDIKNNKINEGQQNSDDPFSFELNLPSFDNEDDETINNSLQNDSILSSITPLDYNFDLDINNNNNSDNDVKNNDDLSLKFDSKLQLNGNGNGNENENENEKEEENKRDDIKYLQSLFDEICDCDGYMECIQTSTCLLLRLNDDQFKKFSEINNVIIRLLESINNQFDVQQIRNILKIVERLLKLQKNVKTQQIIKHLNELSEKWQNGTSRRIGGHTINFGKSQQIVACCASCIKLLAV